MFTSPERVLITPFPKRDRTSFSITTTFTVPPTVAPELLVETAAAIVITMKSLLTSADWV